jgi:hypothetical protein
MRLISLLFVLVFATNAIAQVSYIEERFSHRQLTIDDVSLGRNRVRRNTGVENDLLLEESSCHMGMTALTPVSQF